MPHVVWQQSLSRLKGRVSASELGCWLEAIHPVELRERCLYGEVPSAMHLEQIRARLQGPIAGVLAEVLGPGAELVLCVNKQCQRPNDVEPAAPRACASAYSF
ncbi:MAG TPA: hypothetical protein VMR29_00275, partial [Candidatus Binatia bacterium]|nr:hypothetical protein [Candidatus Binatia bacterium]